MIPHLLTYWCAWALYLELNPRIGGVWLRSDSEGRPVFAPRGLLNMALAPFRVWEFWLPSWWDVNVWIGTLFTIVAGVAAPCLLE